MARWTKQADGTVNFTPVTAVGETLMKKISILVDPETGTVHLGLIGVFGDVTSVVLRPADSARIGQALIEANMIADAS
jgi:hypothetical protein